MKLKFIQMVPAAALVLSAGVLSAQQPTTPPAPRGARPPIEGQMGGAMVRRGGPPGMRMRMGGAPADRLLGLRTQLGLSSDQVSRLEALQKSQATALRPHASDELRARADLMDAMQKGDLNAAHAVIDRLARMHADEQFARLVAEKNAADVLTADQKAKLEQLRGARRHMRGRGGEGAGFGRRGGPGGPPGSFRGMTPQGGAQGFRSNARRGPGGPGVPPARPDSGR